MIFFVVQRGSTIVPEIGVFGDKPLVLLDLLASKRAEISRRIGGYMRTLILSMETFHNRMWMLPFVLILSPSFYIEHLAL